MNEFIYLGIALLCSLVLVVVGQCVDGELRIQNGSTVGPLMICENNVFLGVCSEGFRYPEARAACRQLGYVDGVTVGRSNSNGDISRQRFSCDSYVVALTNGSCTQAMAMCDNNQIQTIACHNNFISTLALDYPGVVQTNFNQVAGQLALPVTFVENIPVGSNFYSEARIYSQGILSFGERILTDSDLAESPLPTSVLYSFLNNDSNVPIIARRQFLNDHPSSPHLLLLSRYVRSNANLPADDFMAQVLIMVQWRFDNTFTVQSALVSDYNRTYVIYIYECDTSYNAEAQIGVAVLGGLQEIFRYSSTPFTSQLACINNRMDVNYYNLFYDLTQPVQMDTSRKKRQEGSCVAAGYRDMSCCRPFEDPTRSCRVQSDSCYCDALCFQRNDCCSDISVLTMQSALQPSLQPCLPLCQEGTVNQRGNVVYPVGRVGVCNTGFIRFIVDDGMFRRINQDITCHQIDNQTASLQGGEVTGTFEMDIYPIYRENVACTGLESRIQDCSFQDDIEATNVPDELMNINCSNVGASRCTNGAVRLSRTDLIEGDSASQGLVEICAAGRWEEVCEPVINSTIETLLCQLANFGNDISGQTSAFVEPDKPERDGVSQLGCSDRASTLLDCSFSLGSCEGQSLLALSCSDEELVINMAERVTLSSLELSGIIVGAVILTIIILMAVAGCVCICVICHLKKKEKLRISKEQNRVSMEDLDKDRYVSQLPLNHKRADSLASSALLDDFSEDLIVPGHEIRLLDCIGQGEFGLVYKAHLLKGPTPEYVAVKTLKGVFDKLEIDEMLKESLCMKKLNHPNVMQLVGICLEADSAPYIVLPFMSGGSLLHYLKKNRSDLLQPGEPNTDAEELEVKLLSMCLQIAKGMEYIAGQNLIHRDLAARNCMIDHEGNIKVSDFGLSTGLYEKMYFRQEKTEGVKLPIKWMAIESIEDGIFSEKTDVWSFGVTCWEVFNGGKTPFGGILPFSIPKMLQEGQRLERPFNSACSQNTYEKLMSDCWAELPDNRPKFSQLVATIDETLTCMAGYIDFNKISLTLDHTDSKTPNDTEDEAENED